MIIGIEGVSCTGKTTLATRLAEHLNAAVIGCYYHCAPSPASLPTPDMTSSDQQLRAVAMLTRIEARRHQLAQAALTAGNTVILDRTIDTILAHAHAVGRLHGYDCDAEARQIVLDAPILIPDLTILLTAPPSVLTARASQRTGMPELFYNPVFTGHFNDYFNQPITPQRITLDSTKPIATIARSVEQHLEHGRCRA